MFRVVLNLCGGNIDTTVLGRCLERGLAAEGRLLKVTVTVSDRPGGIAELCKLISSIGVSIKDVLHERAWVTCDVFSVEVSTYCLIRLFNLKFLRFLKVKVVCETRDYEHAQELKCLLNSVYRKVNFVDFPTEKVFACMD